MKKTFTDIEIPFPLFEAPIDEASEYVGLSQCILCEKSGRHCFDLGIGTAIILPCSQCGTQNGLDAHDQEDILCRTCHNTISFPEFSSKKIYVCYQCLRNGKVALTKDTEYGMVSWEQAFEGVTHGVPYLTQAEFELVPLEEDWVGVKVPQEHMFELLRTPSYLSWQGEGWLFCCQAPMIYLGSWGQEEFMDCASDGDGKKLFDEIVEDGNDALWKGDLHDETGIYVFKCSKCEGMRAQWDMA